MRPRQRFGAAALALVVVAGGAAVAGAATRRSPAPASSSSSPSSSPSSPSKSPSKSASKSSSSAPSAAAGAAAGFRSPRTYAAVAAPVRVRIPAIGVDAPVVNLGLDPDGAVAAPDGFQEVGWYEGGPRPGQPGPAVLLGHVDSERGAAVFYRLATLPPGAQVLVDRADGTTARFRIKGRMQVAKSQFPSDLVYAPTLTPSLRLVTCGGDFDTATGHYRDNVVLTAVPERSRR